MGEGYLETSLSLLHTVIARLIPARWTLTAILTGQCFPVRAGQTLAIVTRLIESRRTVAAIFLDDHLVLVGFEGFAVVPGFVGAGGAGIARAGEGGLGEGGSSNDCH